MCEPKVDLDVWKSEFSKLYNNLNDAVPQDENFVREVNESNQVKELDMVDPLYVSNEFLNTNFSSVEVRKVVMKAKNGKSPGVDGIPYEVLKNDIVINVLTNLFQMCFDSGKIPSLWRKAIVSPIPKDEKNDKRIPMNYRGISLLCNAAKLYSALLNTRIDSFSTSENKIVDEQNGFRKKRCCEDHVFVLDSIVRNRQMENLPTFAAFIDFTKAFDCVNRDFLLFKILSLGIDGKMYFTIKSLYSITESCIKLGRGMQTDWFKTLFGVRQGDSLSPTLFSIYLNDLATEIKHLNKGVNVIADNVSILLYADDIVLLAPTEEDLQSMLDVLSNWSSKWRIFVNKKKTKTVHFRKSTMPQSTFEFKCCGSIVEYVSSYKYLGVTVSEHLDFTENAEILGQASGRALGSVISKYKTHKFMGYKTYTKLYESCVCPVMDYGSSVWGFEDFAKPKSIQL